MAEDTWKNYRQKKSFKPLPLRGICVLEVQSITFFQVQISRRGSTWKGLGSADLANPVLIVQHLEPF
jgi:hypothetical protein